MKKRTFYQNTSCFAFTRTQRFQLSSALGLQSLLELEEHLPPALSHHLQLIDSFLVLTFSNSCRALWNVWFSRPLSHLHCVRLDGKCFSIKEKWSLSVLFTPYFKGIERPKCVLLWQFLFLLCQLEENRSLPLHRCAVGRAWQVFH